MRVCNSSALFCLFLSMFASDAQAVMVDQSYLPFDFDTLVSQNANIGGTVGCSTTGTYDVDSLIWTQVGPCINTGFSTADGQFYSNVNTQARLAALVDNGGSILGGAFALYGTIPGLGISTESLLATGTLIDAFYGQVIYSDGSPSISTYALMDLDFVIDPLIPFGSVLLWQSNTNVQPWNPSGPGAPFTPWQASVGNSDYRNATGSQYRFYDRKSIKVSEPGTEAVFALGLAALGFARRCKRS